MKIRKATKKDLGEIAKLFKIESSKKPYNQAWMEKTAIQKVKEIFNTQEIYVALIKKEIVGFVSIMSKLGSRGNERDIDELWLKSDFQGKGIGTKIIKFIEDKYKKNSFSLCLVSDTKSKALQFYKKLGFKPAKGCVLMDKKLK